MASRATKKPFGKGVLVVTKKNPPCPVIIREAVNSKQWKVELIDEQTCEPKGLFKTFTSQQLRNFKEIDTFPFLEKDKNGSDNESQKSQNSESKEGDNISEFEPEDGDDDDDADDDEQEGFEVVLDQASLDASSVMSSVHSSSDQPKNNKEAHTSSVPSNTDPDWELIGAQDFLEAEDIPKYFDASTDNDGNTLSPEDMAAAIGIEVDEDKHKAKWQQYVLEKQILVDDKWTVKIGPPKQDGLDIGIRVKEKAGQKREGVILFDDRKDLNKGEGSPVWGVVFEGETVEEAARKVPSNKLKRIKDKRVFTWKTVSDSDPTRPPLPYQDHGVIGFDFDAMFSPEQVDMAEGDPLYRHPFLRLLEHLWPGDWRSQLHNLNAYFDRENNEPGQSKKKKKAFVSEREWWIVWGIIIAACPNHKGGEKLFQRDETSRSVSQKVDLSVDKDGNPVISFYRFKTIKERLAMAFFDDTNQADPWHPIASLIKDFNENRRKWIACAIILVLDESMSNFQPRTTKTSLLPHLSFIFRKPKPLGTEYKTAADSATGIMTYLEIQRGAGGMRREPFYLDGVGATAACSIRSLLASAYSGTAHRTRRLAAKNQRCHILLADSWFGGVRMAEAIKLLRPTYSADKKRIIGHHIDRAAGENTDSHEVIAAVKTNHAWFPKEAIEKKMEDWPSGSYLVMEACAPDTNVNLVAMGFKYNARKALCFIMTKEAATTRPGAKHYIARFPDKHGNVCSRRVPRPEAISLYFSHSNLIDVHNHMRQFLLGLERHWKTPNPWLRNVTSVVGITVVDVYRSLRFHCPYLEHWTVEAFADRLAHDCIHNPYSNDAKKTVRGNLVADSDDDDNATIRGSRHGGGMPSVLFNQVQGITQQLQDMMLNCGGDSTVTPSSIGSNSAGGNNFFFGHPTATAAAAPQSAHDAMPIRKKDLHGRSSKRRCVICHQNTHSECSHPQCLARKTIITNNKGEVQSLFGTPICSLNCAVRDGHDNKCMVEHRQEYARIQASGW